MTDLLLPLNELADQAEQAPQPPAAIHLAALFQNGAQAAFRYATRVSFRNTAPVFFCSFRCTVPASS